MTMRALYVSHTGMTEPLGQSQVLPYLRGLTAAGWSFDLLAFEPANVSDENIAALTMRLYDEGIDYRAIRRSPSHALATKVREATQALATLAARALKRRPLIAHARSYLPAAVAQLVARVSPSTRFLFDCRGLLADEYADAGHWQRTSLRYRLTKRAERLLFRGADGVIVLTESARRWLRDESGFAIDERRPIEVIPCCVDRDRWRFDAGARAATRAALGADDRLVVAYAGSLGSWYCEEEMAQLFSAVRRRRPALLAVATRSPSERLRRALADAGVGAHDVDIRCVDSGDMPAWLSGADAALCFIAPCFSKIASSPTKVAEYLSIGLPVVMNAGFGDAADLIAEGAVIGAAALGRDALERAADALANRPVNDATRAAARRAAEVRFDLETVGVARYRRMYERLAS